MFFLVIALMQPEKVDQFKQVKNKGYDLMLAVDISGSMQAVDFSTQSKVISRLDATKDVVGSFVLGRQGIVWDSLHLEKVPICMFLSRLTLSQ